MATAVSSNEATSRTKGARPTVVFETPAVPARLDDLLALAPEVLRKLYEGATVPRLEAIHGDLRGRMLAWPGLGMKGVVAGAVRAFASSSGFPWRGKSFTPLADGRGEGINRVASDRIRLFRFETFVGPSRAGAFDAVQLDYDLPENPFFIRAIKDEIRELRPGLYLGQAWLKTAKSESLVLYFGLAG
jgi:hypothetical protein